MELISESSERDWYLVKEWKTKAGLTARVHQCKWKIAIRLPDHYTGYVLVPESNKKNYYDADIDVHGGITFNDSFDGEEGRWAGFDMGHYGDENIQNPLEFAINECERLAGIIKIDSKV